VVPKLFLGERFYVGEEINFAAIAAELAKPAANSRIDRVMQNKGENREAAGRILARFATFSWLAVALAGLVDGINPCAIATLIFFISFLFFNQNSRRQIAAVGLSFIFGMFLAYFLLGLGFLKAVYSLSAISLIAKLLYPLLTLIVFILAIISLRDYYKMKAGRHNEVALQLPAQFKKMIHRMIRSQYFIKALPVYGFVTGFGISLVEFLCTGRPSSTLSVCPSTAPAV
jgi:cytochrome c biogenesis protein CcdA